MSIVGGSTLESGRKFAVGVDGNANTIHWLDGSEPTSWQGDEVTCCTGCGETVVCPTISGLIYLVSSDGVSSLKLDTPGLTLFGVCRLSVSKAVAGGVKGTLVEIDLENQSAVVAKASSFGLRKPGRDIINVVPFAGGIAAIGKKELIYTFLNFPESAESFGGSGSEAFFYGGCEFAGNLWLSGLVGRTGVLAKYCKLTNKIEYFDTPAEANGRAFSIGAVGDNLVLANDAAYVGSPGNWSRRNGFASPECVAVLPCNTEPSCTLLSLSGETLELAM
jgi:hypothetical protein